MPGLLSDVLPFVYSQGDRAKRYLGGLLSDPVAFAQQALGNGADAINQQNQLAAQAFGDKRNPAKVTNRQAFNQLAEQTFGNVTGFAPVGMTVAQRFNYPQAEALETARKNAVSMLGLAENNTPMDRAMAMGFENGWAHGSPNPTLTELKPSGFGAEGPGAYATNYLPEASIYSFVKDGSTVYPLMVNKSKTLETGNGFRAYEKLNAKNDDELIANLRALGKDSITSSQPETAQWLVDKGAPYMPASNHFVSTNPANFRSRFAAFDPARINENDLLGRADPRLLGLLGLGIGGGLGANSLLGD